MGKDERSADPLKPKLPIPTALAWLLLESLMGANPRERTAQIAAEGAALAGHDRTKALERSRKALRRASEGRRVRPATEAALLGDMNRALRAMLQEAFSPERADELLARLDTAGPFTALANFVTLDTPTAASRQLLKFSEAMDELGAAFSEAVAHDGFACARDLLLDSEYLDHEYWALSEEDLPNAEANRDTLRGANDWNQLIRATVPLNLNVALSWLSMLDIAALSAGKHSGADFSLFEPLITQSTSSRTSSGAREANRSKLPVANLIRMLGRIARDNERNRNKTRATTANNTKNIGEKAQLRDGLKKFKRFDRLSIDRFIGLARCFAPATPPQGDESCGFDVISLLLAANLFSLLTPRDGAIPTSNSRRIVPDEIACFPEVGKVYNRWWRRNRAEVAEGAAKRPRPVWLSDDSSETGRKDRDR